MFEIQKNVEVVSPPPKKNLKIIAIQQNDAMTAWNSHEMTILSSLIPLWTREGASLTVAAPPG